MSSRLRSAILMLPLASLLTGCALTSTETSHSPLPGASISGIAMGGQQPITGAKVYVLAANPAGYGSTSLSLLTSASTGNAVDSIGAYTLTASGTGRFALAGDYNCANGYTLGATTASGGSSLPGTEQVYLYILGGNPGVGTNSSIGLLAALGPCNNLYSNTITVNELTTVAAAYAMAGYASDATHLASSGSALAVAGLSNAGLNSSNLVSLASGLPVASSTGITRPVATLDTLGDILAACVNGKSGNSNCSTLFTYTESSGSTGTAPTDTATAAINLAHNPWPGAAGMTALYAMVPATGAPFSGGLSSQPNDFTLGFLYASGGINAPYGIAIDAAGNAWTANYGNNSVTKLSSIGTASSPSTGYTVGGISQPEGIAIDGSGSAWIANYGNSSVTKLSATGSVIATSTAGGISQPKAIAIDASGDPWVANYGNNSVTKLSTVGALVTTSTTGGISQPDGIAIDGSGDPWIANYGNNSATRLSNTGSLIATSTASGISQPDGVAIDTSGNPWIANYGNSSVTSLSGTGVLLTTTSNAGGINEPKGIAIDGSGSVWVADYYNSSVARLSNIGAPISPSTGYTGGGITTPSGTAIDGSGDVWTANTIDNSVTELIGAAIPVVTPIVASITTPYSAPASKP